MIVAVTGATGFIGREITSQAVDRGDTVRLVTRREIHPPPQTTAFRADITTGVGLTEAFQGADVVIHAAGLAHQHHGATADAFASVNAEACGRVVGAACSSGVSRVVLLSSVSVYGGTRGSALSDEHSTLRPNTPYGLSKLQGEIAASTAVAKSGTILRILRLATVFGAGDPGNFLRLIRAIHRKRYVHIDVGDARKSVIHRSDAARACLVAADDDSATSCRLNVVGETVTVDRIVTTMSDILGVSVPSLRVPSSAAALAASIMGALPGPSRRFANSIRQWRSNEAYSAQAIELSYGFIPRVELVEGLVEEINWYRESLSHP